MGVICALVGLGIFLYGLPPCMSREGGFIFSLFGRIDQEQQAQLNDSFQQRQPRWTIVRHLEKKEDLLDQLCRWMGIDRRKTEDTLKRLETKVVLAELVVVRGFCMVLIASALLYLIGNMYAGHPLRTANSFPLVVTLLLYMLPTWWLDWTDQRIKGEIREQVPIFFSIVQALVEAGMPIQSAVKETARRFDTRLGRELARLDLEEKRLGTWRQALKELAFRWEVDSLTTIALEINEAIRKGVSISGMLAVQVEEQARQLEDEASMRMNRLNIRLLPFVIILMGVPLLFLVMGPALIGLGDRL
ncbi:type II secretion system F family protein [Brevibacillus choshinensis]|uniref:Type II secretion system F family protein n=1 Tax=Brevibacillus choshinensis TaxID=54911 RepID=A0ABX7FRA4_BRECH|nr:type II secretion system F family protein [Brevibacillus choshinensis]QRG67836.1 type II secretion system F family protein [Brevibacillus choshinensis]